MEYTDEELMQEYNNRLYKRNAGTDIGYGEKSGKDYNATLAYLNKQSEEDSNFSKVWKSFYNGAIAYTGRGIIGALQMIRDYNIASQKEKNPDYQPNAEAVAALDNLAKKSIWQPYSVKADTETGQFGLDLVSGAGQLVGQVGTALLFGGAGGALTKAGATIAGRALNNYGTKLFIGSQIAGNQYNDLRQKGVQPQRAAYASIANAAVQTKLEMLSLNKIMNVLPTSVKAKGRQILENAATEGLTEFLQQYPEALTEIYATNEGKTAREMGAEFDKHAGTITKEALYNGVIGFILGGGASRVNIAINGVDEAVQKQVHSAQLEDLKERINEQEKSGISSSYARGVVNANLSNERISVDGEVLWQYAQSKNPLEVTKSLGVTIDDVKRAAEDGLDVDIKQGDFEATARDYKDFLPTVEDDIAFEPGGYTLNRGALHKELKNAYEEIDAEDIEFREQMDVLYTAARKAGARKDVALQAVTLWSAAAKAAYPDNPMQYFRDNPLEIVRAGTTQNGHFLQTKSAEQRLREDEGAFGKSVDEFVSGTVTDGLIDVMRTPLVLKIAGADILPVKIRAKALNKILNGKHNYQITSDIIKQVPRALTDPVAIFYSDTIPGNKDIVVALDLKDVNGSNIVVAFKLNRLVDMKKGDKAYELNLIASIYGKDNGADNRTPRNEWFLEQIQKGNLKYINKKKLVNLFGGDERLLAQSSQTINELPSALSVADENSLVKLRQEMDGYYQTAYHGTPHNFEKFDLGAIGSGVGLQTKGWGLYFSADKKVAEEYKDYLGGGFVVEASIPEKDVLLDSDKPFDEQPPKVKTALDKVISALSDEELENFDDVNRLGRNRVIASIKEILRENTGENIYGTIYDLISDDAGGRQTSLRLNKYGIKGIKYQDKGKDNFVVFDDKAISIINRYNQEAAKEAKGGIYWKDGAAIIELFKGADASTVIHETGHYFIDNLSRAVNSGRATQQQEKDWEILLKYAEVSNDEWVNMNFEERRQAHERFATAFEQYLMEGRSPSKELIKPFRHFKEWLLSIYESIKKFIENNPDAVPLNDDVRQVFDRMLASREDVRTMERINGYFTKLPAVITDNLSESVKQKIQEFTLKAHDKAVDILTRRSLENFTQERKERIAAYRANILPEVEKEIQSQPLYRAISDVEKTIGGKSKTRAKSVAERYLSEEGQVYTDWREELNFVQGEINQQLLPIIERLRSSIDNDDMWYNVWQQTQGRKITAKDLRELAYKIYTGEQKGVLSDWDNWDKKDFSYQEKKEELDELLGREQELLEKKENVSQYRYKGLSNADRMAFDMIAEKHAYTSGEELAQTIITSPTFTRAKTMRADELVQQDFPDIYKERELAREAAKEAFYNDDSGLVLGLEQQLIEDYAAEGLAKQRDREAQKRIALARWKQAMDGAKKELNHMSVAEAIRTSRFINAERRAAVLAAKAITEGDNGKALRYKNQQTLLHAMVRQSLVMRKQAEQYRRYINRQFTVKKDTWINEAHFMQAAAIMQRMGFKRKDYDPFRREQTLSQYVEEMQEKYPQTVAIAKWLLDENVSLASPMQMTFSQFEDIVQALRNIKAIAKAEKGENILGTQSDYMTFVENAMRELNKLETKWYPVAGEIQKAGNLEKFLASARSTDNLFEKMDGWHYGFFSKCFGGTIKRCNDKEANLLMIYREHLAAANKKWLPDKKAESEAENKKYYEELGTSVDKHFLVRMLLNLGNAGNARVLCSNPPAAIGNNKLWVYPEGNINQQEAIERTKSNLLEFLGRNLTEKDIAYAQDIINIAGMNWAEMSALEKRTKGFAPPKVEALPVEITLSDGRTVIFEGGYFPLVRDLQEGDMPQGKEIIDVSATDRNQGRNIRTLGTGNGNLKERVNAEYKIDMSRGAEFYAITNGIHDLCWREAMSDFRRLFNDEVMFYLMKEKLGIANMTAFREMLEKAANPLGTRSTTIGEEAVGAAADWLRRKTVNVAIMCNLKTSIQNLGNVLLYGQSVEGFGYADVFAAITHWRQNYQNAGNYKGLAAMVSSKSVFMRERSEIPDITLRDLREGEQLNEIEKQTLKWGSKFLVATDNLTAYPMWAQAYMKKKQAGADEQTAVDFADMVIRRTLGSSRITDVSSMQRGSSLFKMLTIFQGFFNTQYNQWERQFMLMRKNWSAGKRKEAALNISSFVAAKWAVLCLLNLALAAENPFEEDDDEWLKITKELTHYPISMLGPVGTVANFTIDNMLGFKNYGYRVTAADSALQTLGRTFAKTRKALTEENIEWEEVAESGITLLGYGIGIPGQFNKLFWNAYNIFYDDMEVEFGDLLRRRPKDER